MRAACTLHSSHVEPLLLAFLPLPAGVDDDLRERLRSRESVSRPFGLRNDVLVKHLYDTVRQAETDLARESC